MGFRFPNEIWQDITDLKRHKDVRRGLEAIHANVSTKMTQMQVAEFTNGAHFSLTRFVMEGTPLLTMFFASGASGDFNFFPYDTHSPPSAFIHKIGSSQFSTGSGALTVTQ